MFDINQLSPNASTVTVAYLLFTLFATMLFSFYLSFKTEILRFVPIKSRQLRGFAVGLILWPVGLWATAKPPRPPQPAKVVKLALRPGPYRTNTFYTVDSIITNNVTGDIAK